MTDSTGPLMDGPARSLRPIAGSLPTSSPTFSGPQFCWICHVNTLIPFSLIAPFQVRKDGGGFVKSIVPLLPRPADASVNQSMVVICLQFQAASPQPNFRYKRIQRTCSRCTTTIGRCCLYTHTHTHQVIPLILSVMCFYVDTTVMGFFLSSSSSLELSHVWEGHCDVCNAARAAGVQRSFLLFLLSSRGGRRL